MDFLLMAAPRNVTRGECTRCLVDSMMGGIQLWSFGIYRVHNLGIFSYRHVFAEALIELGNAKYGSVDCSITLMLYLA